MIHQNLQANLRNWKAVWAKSGVPYVGKYNVLSLPTINVQIFELCNQASSKGREGDHTDPAVSTLVEMAGSASKQMFCIVTAGKVPQDLQEAIEGGHTDPDIHP